MSNLKQLAGRRIHFVGIGGAGMSGIARIMLSQGLLISGSDVKESSITQSLAALGADIHIGHDAANVEGVHLLVTSGAISPTNPELLAAQEHGIETITRAQALAILMEGKRSIAVAGTHGKTTTTSMLTVALQRAGLDPSFAIGGLINSSGINAHLGSGDIFIAEADESDGSFTAYHPLGAIITNLELDHVDHFASIEDLYAIFVEFIATIQSNGFVIACIDDPGVVELLSRVQRKDLSIITYGARDGEFAISRVVLEPASSFARITKNGKVLPELHLTIPGLHNLFNATAALAAGERLGASVPELLSGLESFSGSRRRFEHKGKIHDIEVIDDYGHHPTELRVTLETAKAYAAPGRVIVVFQPHRFSRTQVFFKEFAKSLELADRAFVLEVYPASEAPIPGVTSQLITRASQSGTIFHEPSMLNAVHEVLDFAEPGDLIMTLGAGDVNSLAPVIVQALEERYA
ncbi:MAG: UDP-N-acetylmuramate--L-alanine ligase [Actinomycetes bacterium]